MLHAAQMHLQSPPINGHCASALIRSAKLLQLLGTGFGQDENNNSQRTRGSRFERFLPTAKWLRNTQQFQVVQCTEKFIL